jgi:alkanesulfonate monooxygenase SsuD/methylene tetrahydromethanopterin reductase-like flavin-dependent oxidoreductase (luciferase family)
VAIYRRDFRPSSQLEAPYVIAGMNVLAADRRADAEAQFQQVQRSRVKILLGRGLELTDDDAQAILDSPAGQTIKAMATYSAVGEEAEVKAAVARFAKLAHADEIMTVHPAPTLAARLRSIELLAASEG